jgi:hypothetical protein
MDACKDVVRRYKAAGTDFIDALRKLLRPADTAYATESANLTVTATCNDTPIAGPIYVGAGWRVGAAGLKVGTNNAIVEQVYVEKILESNSTVESLQLAGG